MNIETIIRQDIRYIQVQNPPQHATDRTRDTSVLKMTEAEALKLLVTLADFLDVDEKTTFKKLKEQVDG